MKVKKIVYEIYVETNRVGEEDLELELEAFVSRRPGLFNTDVMLVHMEESDE